MKPLNLIRSAAAVALFVALWTPVSAHAQGQGRATMSVGLTIVAADSAAAGNANESAAVEQPKRIPVDPIYAIRTADPLRDARVERVALADGEVLQVVSY